MQVDKIYTTKSYKQTQKIGEDFASVIARARHSLGEGGRSAIVVGLSGNLGGGKTTFLQGFAKALGIKQKILSPTFVIMKKFPVPKSVKTTLSRDFHRFVFHNFYHIDCYRLKNQKDILELGWKEIIKNPENIIAVEWPEKIKKVLPKNTIFIEFKFIDENNREINFKK